MLCWTFVSNYLVNHILYVHFIFGIDICFVIFQTEQMGNDLEKQRKTGGERLKVLFIHLNSGAPIHGTKNNGSDFIHKKGTDRKRTLKALQETQKKYRNIFDNSPLGIFRTTFSGQLLTANRTFARSLGFDTPEDLLGTVTNLVDIYVNPRDREKLKKN